ncbi:MAG: hypothetical protein HUK20_15635, partial [Fibrobacter sp.]|nr:hypothetical protein [Fibrobacter sp.]
MTFSKCIASCLVALFLCSCDNEQYVLAFNTENVPSQTYHLESSLNSFVTDSAEGRGESMKTELEVRAYNNLLTAYDDGSAKFELKVDSVSYKSDKRTVEEFRDMERMIATENFQYKMAKDGMITSTVFEDSLAMGEALDVARLLLKVQPILPGKPVKVGESWERSVEIPGKSRNTVVYKSFSLQDQYVHDGFQMAKIDMFLKYKESPDTTSGVRMESRDFILGEGTFLFNMTQGVIVYVDMKLTGDLKM